MLFKLNWGTHRVTKGSKSILFHEGDVIETSSNLAELFTLRNPITGNWKFVQVESNVLEAPDIPVVKRSPSKSVETVAEQTVSTASPSDKSDKSDKKKDLIDVDPAVGEDITEEFPLAEELNLKVYFNGVKYTVVDSETNETVSKGKMSKSKDVTKLLDSYVEEEEEEEDK